jgi:hypothetical protein
MTTLSRGCGLFGVLLLAAVVSGCQGDGRVRVRGKVTVQGTPAAGQTLTLHSGGGAKDFFAVRLPIKADGSFEGEVPARGDYKVLIEESMAVMEGRKPTGGPTLKIPARYRTAAGTDLVWPIHDADNFREFDLKE